MSQRKLLLISTDPKLARLVSDLVGGSFCVAHAGTGEQAGAHLRPGAPLEVLLVDHAPPVPVAQMVRLLERAQELRPDVRRGLLTGYGDVGEIIRAVHTDAAQFVLYRPVVPAELLAALALVPRPDAVSAARPAGVAA